MLSPRTTARSQATDESYSVDVTNVSATITAKTEWGALRGMETFSQLVTPLATKKKNSFSLPHQVQVRDAPRFGWRGLMIDTGRNYLTPTSIRMVLDTMAYTKLNVLHWSVAKF